MFFFHLSCIRTRDALQLINACLARTAGVNTQTHRTINLGEGKQAAPARQIVVAVLLLSHASQQSTHTNS